jgi:hypothetical protein
MREKLAIGVYFVFSVILFTQLNSATADGQKPPNDYTVVYMVGDLPVWQRIPKTGAASFDAMLIDHIQTVVAPEAWTGTRQIRPFEKNESLIITQSGANHEAVSDLLQRMRDEIDARYKREFDGKSSVK